MTRIFRGACSAAILVGVPLFIASSGCYGTSQVREVFMGLDSSGDRVRDTFFTDSEKIVCNVAYSGGDPDSTLVANFLQTSGEVDLFDGSNQLAPVAREWASAEIAPGKGNSIQSFSMEPPQPTNGGAKFPFPVGNWKCVVTLNGQPAGETQFKVIYPNPDCPASGVASAGNNCTAYQLNATCPSSSNYLNPTACTCVTAPPNSESGLRVWSCTE
jgi:hypothetical protein